MFKNVIEMLKAAEVRTSVRSGGMSFFTCTAKEMAAAARERQRQGKSPVFSPYIPLQVSKITFDKSE